VSISAFARFFVLSCILSAAEFDKANGKVGAAKSRSSMLSWKILKGEKSFFVSSGDGSNHAETF
jgi:hypothetical protein